MGKTKKYKKIPELDRVIVEARFIDWLTEAFFNSIISDKHVDVNDSYVVAAAGLMKSIQAFNKSLEIAYYDLCVAQEKEENKNKRQKQA